MRQHCFYCLLRRLFMPRCGRKARQARPVSTSNRLRRWTWLWAPAGTLPSCLFRLASLSGWALDRVACSSGVPCRRRTCTVQRSLVRCEKSGNGGRLLLRGVLALRKPPNPVASSMGSPTGLRKEHTSFRVDCRVASCPACRIASRSSQPRRPGLAEAAQGCNALSSLSACSAEAPSPARRAYIYLGLNSPKLFIPPNVSSQSLAARRRRCFVSKPVGFNKRFRRGFDYTL